MRIALEDSFKNALKTGVNLFLGAGFSVGAKNKFDEYLPLANNLSQQLAEKFCTPKLDLARVATIIESKNRDEFYAFLKEKYSVVNIDRKYQNLDRINLNSIYTTNIDDLIFKIFSDSNEYYINDTTLQGPSFRDRKAVDYFPLHGCVLNDDRPMIFTSLAVASSFSSNPRLWNDLLRSLEMVPTIFWGYSLSDPGILETLSSIKSSGFSRSEKWVILHKENADEEEYFKALGFSIIVASNAEMLEYFQKEFINSKLESRHTFRKPAKELFGEDFIPASLKDVPVREVNEFFLGAAPTWSDIFRKDIVKTSHLKKIQNSIFSQTNTIVIGIPGSGKTTLLMQLAVLTEFDGYKVILEFPSFERVRNIVNVLNGQRALIFVDNFTDEVSSFLELHKHENIKLVGFDREHNFEIVSHLLRRHEFEIISITTLTPEDIQALYSSIPSTIKSQSLRIKNETQDDDPSLFEFLNLNLRLPNINERYKNLLSKLDQEDELLSEFLVLVSYVHNCRTPLSFDMVHSYFLNDVNSYKEIYELRDTLGSLLVDNPLTLIEEDDQDYFSTRSSILSEVIIEQVDSKLLKRVLNQFTENLPPYKIVHYRTFRKRGHDKFIAIKAYSNWEEGKAFYERLMLDDPKNPYLLQQGALYLSFKKQYNEAFYWIDKARNMTRDGILSIRNSHAIILFAANIGREGIDVRSTLDNSISILIECYNEDKRKLYHAKKFAEQVVAYFNRYGDEKATSYLKQAKKWLEDELRNNSWDRSIRRLLRDVNDRLR